MNLCIIQARMGSSRLPGKVLRDVHGKPILQHVVDRLLPARFIDKLVVATTTQTADDAIEKFCLQKGILFFRGSDWDVLDRFYQCALAMGVGEEDNIIRICCDNPIHSHHVVDFVMDQFLKLGIDYCSNSNFEPHYLEDGFDVEVTSFKALQRAWKEAKLMSEREHVMPFIKNSGLFRLAWRKSHEQYHFKLSVDTEADLQVADTIFKELAHMPDFSIGEVVDLLAKNPWILELNKGSEINSGYRKSLEEDRNIE